MVSQEARSLSLLDNLRFNVLAVIPYVTQGLFTRSRFWVGLWARVHPDPMGVRLISHFRHAYGSQYLTVRLLTTRAVLVLDLDGVRQVLDNSPTIYADPASKHRGMAHFQPNAVTISRGAEWRDRRGFNEAVLGGGAPLHPLADHLLAIVRDEIGITRSRLVWELAWDDLRALFERITLQVIFGTEARNDVILMALLQRMMRESNRPFGQRQSPSFAPFYERIRHYLQAPGKNSLLSLFAQAPSSAITRVENQIPHWMFAMNETLATNTARALALIVAHPEAERRAREEMAGQDLTSPTGIQQLTYLEGCLEEAMRLWPTTLMLIRETVTGTQLGPTIIPPKTQVIIHNGFNHRDRETYPLADVLAPEAWPAARADYRFNHLSHGPQACAGSGLVRFIGTAVLAGLLSQDRYRLRTPRLDPRRPLPHALDYFALTFARLPLSA